MLRYLLGPPCEQNLIEVEVVETHAQISLDIVNIHVSDFGTFYYHENVWMRALWGILSLAGENIQEHRIVDQHHLVYVSI